MRNHILTNLLVGLAALCILATAALAIYYVQSLRRLNALQYRVDVTNRNRALANSLIGEVVEYAKRNPAIDPVLQSVGIKPRPAAPSSQPAAKQ